MCGFVQSLACVRESGRNVAGRRSVVLAALTAAALALLAACAGDLTTRGEALRLLGSDLPRAILREPYEGTVQAVGGLRPYTFTLTSGALPPGIALQNGVLRGAATEVGTFEVTISVSDANLSQVSQSYTLQVAATLPPRFVIAAPDTEVRSPVTVRARLEDARLVTAARALITWDPAQLTLSAAGPAASRRDVALVWRAAPGELQVDLAALGNTLGGNLELFSFVLEPVATPTRVQAGYSVEVLSASADPDRQHDYLTGAFGTRPAAAGPSAPPTEPTGDEDGQPDDGAGGEM